MKRLIQRVATTASVAVVVALGVGAGGASTAQANTDYYCTYASIPYQQTCEGALHSLTNNQVDQFNGTGAYLCAGAHDQSHNNYASFVCSYTSTYHCYSGQNLLYPLAYNLAGYTIQVFPREGYGSAPCPA